MDRKRNEMDDPERIGGTNEEDIQGIANDDEDEFDEVDEMDEEADEEDLEE